MAIDLHLLEIYFFRKQNLILFTFCFSLLLQWSVPLFIYNHFHLLFLMWFFIPCSLVKLVNLSADTDLPMLVKYLLRDLKYYLSGHFSAGVKLTRKTSKIFSRFRKAIFHRKIGFIASIQHSFPHWDVSELLEFVGMLFFPNHP